MKTSVESGMIAVCSREEGIVESDGYVDWWLFHDVYLPGASIPTEKYTDCKILREGEASDFFDEYAGYCTVKNVGGTAIYYDQSGAKLYDDEGYALDEQGCPLCGDGY